MKGVSVNPEGECRHRQVRAKMARKERKYQPRMERKADRNALGEEGEEIRSPRKKVIRVESEETQDYVRESLNLSRDEAEEISFVPCALRIPQKPTFWCDNRCREEASVLVEDGEESYTANLCQQCYNESMTANCLAPWKNWQWKEIVEKKAHRGRLWRMLGKTSFHKECVGTSRSKD